MSTPILDDPQDLDNQTVPKISSRYWLAAGMGMAILLLAYNLLDKYYPQYWFTFKIGKFSIDAYEVVYVSVFTLGMIWLTEALLRVKPVPKRWIVVKNALFSSIFAICTFLSIEIFATFEFEAVQVLSIFINTAYCLLVAFAWYSLRRKKV
jgi:hypothetical protein